MGGAGLKMSTFTRLAGGTTFLRHVHLKAGIEVPRAPLVVWKERFAPAAPREERGPGAPLAASAARSWPCGLQTHAFPDEGDLRRRGHGTTSRRVPSASKTRISADRFLQTGFFARAGVSEPPRRASFRACATAISRRRRGGRSSRHIYSETGPAGAPDHHALRSSHWQAGAQWAARAEELGRDAVHSLRRRSDARAAAPSAVAAEQRAHGPHRAVGLRRVQ